MKIAFFSNYLTHHQIPICNAFLNSENVEFKFVATTTFNSQRIGLGYKDLNQEDYVIRAYENEEQHLAAKRIADEYDVVIAGSVFGNYIEYRKKRGKLTFVYSERLYKTGFFSKDGLRNFKNTLIYNTRFILKPVYLLCASAFSARDFSIAGAYINKAYKWGYFPEVKKYDNIYDLINKKEKHSLLWVGRYINWKHPEYALIVAKKLKDDGYDFKLNILGSGIIEEYLKALIFSYGIEENINFLGAMPPECVREYMEQSEIFLFTSDRNEGWGAVLNEAMNSACAVVASSAIGSVPFLINDEKNGLIYKDGNADDLYKKIKYLIDNPQQRVTIGASAYETLSKNWNAKVAVERFLELVNVIQSGKKYPDLFKNDVCSRADRLKDGWYK